MAFNKGISDQGFKRIAKLFSVRADFLNDLDEDLVVTEIDSDKVLWASLYEGWYAGLSAKTRPGSSYLESLNAAIEEELAAHASNNFDPDAFEGAYILALGPGKDTLGYQAALQTYGDKLREMNERLKQDNIELAFFNEIMQKRLSYQKYKTRLRGFTEIDGTMIAKVDIFQNGEVVDGAWGTWDEILAWCDEKGYPPPSEK